MTKLIKKIISAPFLIVGIILFLFGYAIIKGLDRTNKLVDHLEDFDHEGILN